MGTRETSATRDSLPPLRRATPARFMSVVAAAVLVAACSGSSATPTTSAAPAATAAPSTAAVSAAATAAAASAGAGAAASPQLGGTLRLAQDSDVQTWDPALATANTDLWTQPLVYMQLNECNVDCNDLVPDAATSWDVNPNGEEVIYHLRSGLKDAEGNPITAADAAFSVNRYAAPNAPNGGIFPAGFKATAVDDVTMETTSTAPSPLITSNLSLVPIYSQACFNKVGGATGIGATPCSSGPFELKTWNRGSEITLVRNPNFYDAPKPYLDEVDIMIVPDANTRLLELQAGQIDVDVDVPYASLTQLKSDPTYNTIVRPLSSGVVMQMDEGNASQPWFKDLKIRQAINYAIDKQGIITAALNGFGTPMTSILATGQWVDQNGQAWPYDVAKAKQLMSASKYPNGFTTTLIVKADNPTFTDAATIIKQDLAAIGITVNIQPLDASAARAAVVNSAGGGNPTYDMALIYNYTNGTLDNGGLFWFLADGEKGAYDSNRTFYNDTSVDALIDKANAELNATTRASEFAQLQSMVWNAAPFGFLWVDLSRTATSAKVHGFTITAEAYHPLTDVWIEH